MMRLRFVQEFGAVFWGSLGVVSILIQVLSAGVGFAVHWPIAGQNLENTRSQESEHTLNADNVSRLQVKWVVTTENDVSATPTVVDNDVYIPDWADAIDPSVGGNLFSIDKRTGHVNWSRKIADYTGVPGSMSRTSPAVMGNTLFLGTWPPGGQARSGTWPEGAGAQILAVNRNTGELLWKTTVDTFMGAQITGSLVVFGNVVYGGVSSGEEGYSENRDYPCCVFRGSVFALDARTGRKIWQTYLVPDNGGKPGGYSGAAVWSIPAVDVRRGSLIVATGNNYRVPPDVEACQREQRSASCIPPGTPNYFNAVVSLDLKTGEVKWATGVDAFDTWTRGCFDNPHPNCPVPESPDWDFGGGVNLFVASDGKGRNREVIGAGHKSGIYWTFNPQDGQILWNTQIGPGGTLGGMQWGTAVEDGRIFGAISNNSRKSYTLFPSGQVVSAGSWSALDATTGHIIWQTADPNGGIDPGAVSVADGVVYGGSMDSNGYMYALDARTGEILWQFASGGSVICGPAIVDGVVYWGSGYRRRGIGTGNNKLYTFSVPGPE
jgi:polyvinyl alcohol dehydrogenase (cytochrome)